ncbi:hypothetical protein HPDP_00456 [Candidatus Hepatincola sp. Pdp]
MLKYLLFSLALLTFVIPPLLLVDRSSANDFEKYNKADVLEQQEKNLEQSMAPMVSKTYGSTDRAIDSNKPSDKSINEGTDIGTRYRR